MDGFGFGHGFGLLFWVIIIALIVFLLGGARALTSGNGGASSGKDEDPLEILKRRYARGEIDQEEFERRREALEK